MQLPSRQLTQSEEELFAVLRQRFFLIPRDYRKTILGGVLAFFVATGVISWGAAKAALEMTITKQAANEILSLRDTARQHVEALQTDSYIHTGSTIVLESVKHPKWRLHNYTDKRLSIETNAPSSEFVQWNIHTTPK